MVGRGSTVCRTRPSCCGADELRGLVGLIMGMALGVCMSCDTGYSYSYEFRLALDLAVALGPGLAAARTHATASRAASRGHPRTLSNMRPEYMHVYKKEILIYRFC